MKKQSSKTVPYSDIDREVRGLVELMNLFPGIKTIGSCSGHKHPFETLVDFEADTLEHLRIFAESLPLLTSRSRILFKGPTVEAVFITLSTSTKPIVFQLHVAGHPQSVQRQLLGEVESSLATAIDELRLLR